MKNVIKKTSAKLGLMLVLALTLASPTYAAILVQNFMELEFVVETPPINKVQGVDANYDGDNDDTTGYLTVNLGGTIGNSDDTLGTPGTNETLLSNEEISFTCFTGDRTYYTDVLQLVNTTGTEDWDVTLTVEADIAGNLAVADTFTAGDADVYMFTSSVDSTAPVVELPNPTNYGSLTNWLNAAAPNGAIQLEVVGGVLSTAQAVTGPFTVPATEQRQVALVVDCGSNMVTSETGTFRVTVAATPN